MNKTKATEVKVGVTVVVGTILILWILGWAKDVDFFSDNTEIKILFNSVAGLETGDRVSVNGVKKGTVERMEAFEDGVLVIATLDPDTDLREDATFSIMMLDLMGGKKIEVSPGVSPTRMDFASVQNGKFSGDISSAMAAISDVQEDLVSVIKEIKISLTNINKFMANEEFANNVEQSVTNLNELLLLLNDVTTENRENLARLIVNVDTLVTSTNTFLAENRNVVGDLSAEITNSLQKTNNLINKITTLTDETASGNNNLGKLLYDEDLLNDLKATIKQTNNLFDILIKQLQDEGVNVDANIF
ncbi:MAG: hypothetical protein SCALA702_31700 [Melioribacteraceae bacterium]|nr:MAG: hypothetical protein SCALA702_31700 [Melioribacteraceae bacterium]